MKVETYQVVAAALFLLFLVAVFRFIPMNNDSQDAPVVEEMRYCYNEGCKLRGLLLVSLQAETWDQDDSIATLKKALADKCKFWLYLDSTVVDGVTYIYRRDKQAIIDSLGLYRPDGSMYRRVSGDSVSDTLLSLLRALEKEGWRSLDTLPDPCAGMATYKFQGDYALGTPVDPCAGMVSIAAVEELVTWHISTYTTLSNPPDSLSPDTLGVRFDWRGWQRLTEGSR